MGFHWFPKTINDFSFNTFKFNNPRKSLCKRFWSKIPTKLFLFLILWYETTEVEMPCLILCLLLLKCRNEIKINPGHSPTQLVISMTKKTQAVQASFLTSTKLASSCTNQIAKATWLETAPRIWSQTKALGYQSPNRSKVQGAAKPKAQLAPPEKIKFILAKV